MACQSRRPHSHPKQHTEAELKLIRDMRRRNPDLGLVELWHRLKLRGYTRRPESLFRVMRKLGMLPQRKKKKAYTPKPYQQMIRPGSKIHSDALGSFRAALQGAYVHHYQVFDKDSGALRWVHTLISKVKSFLLGTYHGLGKKHLQSYFDEFAFRFNRRFCPEQLFPRLVRAVAASYILGYGDLTR